MSFDRDHFGIYMTGEFTICIFKIMGLATPPRPVIDEFSLDFFFPQIYKCHQSEPWRKTQVGLFYIFSGADLLKATEGNLRCP